MQHCIIFHNRKKGKREEAKKKRVGSRDCKVREAGGLDPPVPPPPPNVHMENCRLFFQLTAFWGILIDCCIINSKPTATFTSASGKKIIGKNINDQ